MDSEAQDYTSNIIKFITPNRIINNKKEDIIDKEKDDRNIVFNGVEYDLFELISAYHIYNSLMSAGVDNWEGYSIALESANIPQSIEEGI